MERGGVRAIEGGRREMSLKEIIAIILIVIFVSSYLFVILRMYFLVNRIVKDNEKLKKFLKLIKEESE